MHVSPQIKLSVKDKKRHQKIVNPFAKKALKGCDWFVNTQVIEEQPFWDANHGRVPYNIHMPTNSTTLGLCWSMARAVYCLLSAYHRTGEEKYLVSAAQAIGYDKSLQEMDSKNKHFGSFHEETPQSIKAYPRDGIETAGAFLVWANTTKDKDTLRRAELYLDWYLNKAYKKAGKFGQWAIPELRYDEVKPRLQGFHQYQSGAGYIFNYAYQITGKTKYKKICVDYATNAIKNYSTKKENPWMNKKGTVYLNEDGMGVSILAAYHLTGNRKFLDACLYVSDYFAKTSNPSALKTKNEFTADGLGTSYAGLPATINFMLEVDRITGKDTYSSVAKKMVKTLLKSQVTSKNKQHNGGFRGEDEVPEWYVKNSKADDFLVTRVTAYAVLSLFKLEGISWGQGYSVELN